MSDAPLRAPLRIKPAFAMGDNATVARSECELVEQILRAMDASPTSEVRVTPAPADIVGHDWLHVKNTTGVLIGDRVCRKCGILLRDRKYGILRRPLREAYYGPCKNDVERDV